MTIWGIADHLSQVFLNTPLENLPDVAPPLSGEKTKKDMIAIAEYLKAHIIDQYWRDNFMSR